MPFVYYLIISILTICWIMWSDNIIIELYKLSQNMNWLNGCVLSWHWHGSEFEPRWT